jgi:hypothetical protein
VRSHRRMMISKEISRRGVRQLAHAEVIDDEECHGWVKTACTSASVEVSCAIQYRL